MPFRSRHIKLIRHPPIPLVAWSPHAPPMPQTLLALLALVLSSLLVFNHQRLAVQSQRTMIVNEVEMAATGLAAEIIEFAGARSFDASSTPKKVALAGGTVPTTLASFSPAADFGSSATCPLLRPSEDAPCDDIDDLDGIEWAPVAIDVSLTDSLQFEARVRVYYVDDVKSMDPAPAPTYHKRVVLDLRSTDVPDREDGSVRVTRVFSYDAKKARRDYENSEDFVGIAL